MIDKSFYFDINDAVNAVFFDGRYEGQPVYLDLEDNVLNEIADKLGEAPEKTEELLSLSVANTIEWSEANIYQFHKKNMMRWHRSDSENPPPFTALLLTLSLAAERMRDDGKYSSHNYYQRLAQVFHVSNQARTNKLSQSGKNTLIFWKTLNLWLSETDYMFGKPTAKKVNSWTYVSYAISQSLVRDADRKRFHKMFNYYGFSPNDNLTEIEIMLYLHEWMGRGSASGWLKKLWQSSDLRQRVAYAAVEELANWDNAVVLNKNSNSTSKRLLWTVIIRSFPRVKISLFLGASGIDIEDIGELQLDDSAEGAALIAFAGSNNIWFSLLQGTEIAYLEPTSKIKLDALMQASLKLQDSSMIYSFTHDARPIVPLIKVDGSTYFREVSKISLLTQFVILCHDVWINKVKDYLDKYARPGFSVVRGNGSNGLPSQWYLVNRVEIVSPVPGDDVEDSLQTLVPFSDGVIIQLRGGLKLTSGIWHASAPPDVMVTSDQGLLDITLGQDKFGVAKTKKLHIEKAETYDPSFLSKLGIDYEGRNFTLVAGKGKREIQIAFRSSNIPRKLLPDRDRRIGYILDDNILDKKGFSANNIDELQGSAILRGLIVSQQFIETKQEGGSSIGEYFEQGLDLVYEEEDKTQHYDSSEVDGSVESCIIRGYHVWECEPYIGPGTTTSRVMRCKNCQAIQVAPKRRRGRRRQAKPVVNGPIRPTTLVPENQSERICADTVLDAICYVGVGNWSTLESLLSSHIEYPWQAQEFARNLVDLGLLDAQFSKSWGKPSYWNCPPSALVVNETDGIAFLSGFRSTDLLDQISDAMSGISDPRVVEQSFMKPSLYKWDLEGQSIDEINDALSSVADPYGRNIPVVKTPAAAIVSSMPSVNEMMSSLANIYIDATNEVEKFNIQNGRWHKSKLDGKGAYRTVFAGRRYFYHDSSGTSHEGGHELIKLLDAREAGISLHGYDATNGNFEAVLGCAPPGLYRRALVSLNGDLPEIVDGKLIYKSVPRKLAAYLFSKLYK